MVEHDQWIRCGAGADTDGGLHDLLSTADRPVRSTLSRPPLARADLGRLPINSHQRSLAAVICLPFDVFQFQLLAVEGHLDRPLTVGTGLFGAIARQQKSIFSFDVPVLAGVAVILVFVDKPGRVKKRDPEQQDAVAPNENGLSAGLLPSAEVDVS